MPDNCAHMANSFNEGEAVIVECLSFMEAFRKTPHRMLLNMVLAHGAGSNMEARIENRLL